MYHTLADHTSPIALSPGVFARQMEWLHTAGIQVITLSQLVACIKNKAPLPRKAAVITFDDGFASVFTHALPHLARYNFPATVFLVSNHCGGHNNWPNQPASVPSEPLLTWSQIREMESARIEFGGHTATHPRLDQLSSMALEDELIVSKQVIENRLGHDINMFAYPYGRFNRAIRHLVGQIYTGACSTQLALAGPASDALALPRLEALYVAWPALFAAMFNPLFSPYLIMRRLLRRAAALVLNRAWA
jgi:peptidoglycan/xylan/chitin deacetylase (PgdA/CDA1 family)